MKKNFLKTTTILTQSKGASMVEYGLILAAVVFVSVASVSLFGQNVSTYFSKSSEYLENPEGFSSGEVTFVYADPEPLVIPDDIFGHGPGNYLYGTPYSDALENDGTYDGVYGLAKGDIIKGHSRSEKFVGGLGDDRISGGKGADIYSYARGDGVDVIDERDGDSSTDVLQFLDVNSTDVTGTRMKDNLIMDFGSGGGMVILGYFEQFEYDAHFERVEFADKTLTSIQEFRDFVADIQKPSGIVWGTKQNEDFTHTVSKDGSYTLEDDHYLAPVSLGSFTFTDANQDDVSIRRVSSGKDYEMKTSDGDIIRIADFDSVNVNRYGFATLVFQDGSLDQYGIRSKAFQDQQASGVSYFVASSFEERLVHDMLEDGTYRFENNNYSSSNSNVTLERFEIENATVEDVSFEITGELSSKTGFRMTFSDGDVVTIDDAFWITYPSWQKRGISGVDILGDPSTSADDVSFDLEDLVAKVHADQKSTGFVRGLNGPETFVYNMGDPDLSYYAGYGSHTDIVDLTDFAQADVISYTKERYSRDLRIEFTNGQVLVIQNQIYSSGRVEELHFSDGVVNAVTLFSGI